MRGTSALGAGVAHSAASVKVASFLCENLYAANVVEVVFSEVVESRSALGGEALRHRSCTPHYLQPRLLKAPLQAGLPQPAGEAPVLGLTQECELTLAELLGRVGLVHRSCLLRWRS
jgi:hypothetical protein